MCKATEYLGILIGAIILGVSSFQLMISGTFLAAITGFLLFAGTIGAVFLLTIREILYWAQHKDIKKGGQ